jgi:hypothetical protein
VQLQHERASRGKRPLRLRHDPRVAQTGPRIMSKR